MILRIINAVFRRLLLPVIVKKQIFDEQKKEEMLVLANFPSSETLTLTDEEKNLVCQQMGGVKIYSFGELGLFKKHRGLTHGTYLILCIFP